MGSFLTNIQVHRNGQPPQQVREAILAALNRAPSFAVAIDPEGDWLTVYGESMDTQDGSHEALAERLSKTLNTTVIAVLLHDSDVLTMTALRDGTKEASYSNWPAYFEGGPKKPKIEGEEFWNGLLRSGGSPSKLKAAFRSRDVFGEDTLAGIAKLFGWNERLAVASYKDLEDLAEAEQIDVVRTEEPVIEVPAAERMGAPVSLMLSTHGRLFDLFVDERSVFGLAIESRGGASRGLEIRLSGPALEAGHARPVDLTIRPQGPETEVVPFEKNAHGAFIARLPNVAIPDGTSVPSILTAVRSRGRAQVATLKARAAATIPITVNLRGTSSGHSRLRCECVPMANPEGGSSSDVPVEVRPRSSRPLRFNAAQPGTARFLAMMEQPDFLFGLFVFAADDEATTTFALGAIEKWAHTVLDPGEKLDVTAMDRMLVAGGLAGPMREPHIASWRVVARNLLAGKPGEKLRHKLASDTHVSIDAERRIRAPATVQRGTIHWGREIGSEFHASKDNPAARQLTLTMDAMESESRTRAADSLVRKLLDEALDRGLLLQGLVGRWGMAPSSGSLAYEIVCGLNGVPTSLQRWSSRWLRAVTPDGVWLGPSLVAALGDDVNHVESVADVEALGSGLRIVLKPGASLRDLESALERVLPSAADGVAVRSEHMAALRAKMRPPNA
jgi:hypothetical protein